MAGRRRPGQGRMDAAVDHFAPMGYNKADVRKLINALLKVYGKKGWLLLEDNCYQVVQEALFEKQEEEEKMQLLQLEEEEEEEPQVMQLQQHEEEEEEAQEALFEEQEQEEMLQLQQQEEEPQEQQQEEDDEDQEALSEKHEQEEMLQLQQQEEEPQHVQEDQPEEEQQWDEGDEDQQQEAAMIGAPSENDMSIVKVHDEVACETALAVLQTEEDVIPMIIDPPAPEAASPHPEATGSGRTRLPCYGWISESESDSDYEEFLASRNRSCTSQVKEETFLKGSGSVGGM